MFARMFLGMASLKFVCRFQNFEYFQNLLLFLLVACQRPTTWKALFVFYTPVSLFRESAKVALDFPGLLLQLLGSNRTSC
jgi:hypothetical protein